jgi:cob(I)alamin adenosyltransferase
MPSDFTVPGENRASAALDLARMIVRRAERVALVEPDEGSFAVIYLNRLSDPAVGDGALAGGAGTRCSKC